MNKWWSGVAEQEERLFYYLSLDPSVDLPVVEVGGVGGAGGSKGWAGGRRREGRRGPRFGRTPASSHENLEIL